MAVASIISGVTGTKSIEAKNPRKKMPTSITQIRLGSPKKILGPTIIMANEIITRPNCIITSLEYFSQSRPVIGEPNPNENPMMANAKPTLFSDMPMDVSLTERTGSMNIIHSIAIVQIAIAVSDLLFERIYL